MSEESIQPIIPRALKSGDRISVIAPASPFDKAKFEKGISVLAEMGFFPVFTDDLFLQDRYLAGPDIHRARKLNEAFINSETRAVWCARGGYGALRMLAYMDFKSITAHPKIFVGCSDISAILNTLYSKSKMVSFHGPMIESLAIADEITKKVLYDVLISHQPLTVIPREKAVICPGSASGKVSGGNLTTICHLIGTPFQPDFTGQILLIEDTGEAPYRIDRMLSQMKMAGCFNNISGLVLGSFEKCGEIDQIYHIFQDILADRDVPILAGFDVGHGFPNLTIPFGIDAHLDTERGILQYQSPHLDLN